MRSVLVVAGLSVWTLVACSGVARETVVAPAGAPELAPSAGRSILFAQPEQEFRELAARLIAEIPAFVDLKRKPEGLSDRARFGQGWTVGRRNVCWVWDELRPGTDRLWIDWNANGDLTDDGDLLLETRDGTKQAAIERSVTIEEENGRVDYAIRMEVRVQEWETPKSTEPTGVLAVAEETVRRGTLELDGRRIAFGLIGEGGVYGEADQVVHFDLDGDGAWDWDNPYDDERFPVVDPFVTVGDRSYRFAVDRLGREITLVRQAERLPDRAIIRPGHPAPDFKALDTDGERRGLSDYRGKVVLLDFWTIGCQPCVDEAPDLVEAYRRYRVRGFEILSINSHDTKEALLDFVGEHGMSWPQIQQEDFEAPLMRLYRIRGWPSYFLVDADGTLLTYNLRAPDLPRLLDEHLAE